MNAVTKAVSMFPSRAALARELGVSAEAIRKWERGKIPIARAVELQRATDGAVTVRELRPDLPEDIFGLARDTAPGRGEAA